MAKGRRLPGHRQLFFQGFEVPTMRTVADRIRAGGVTALVDARVRSDSVRYQEVRCRSALNRTWGMPFSWTLNPYRGCTHGCHYCYARRYHTQFEMGTGDEFSSVVLVKTNLVSVLRAELSKHSWLREEVAIGTATDAYQPIEGHYRLTRRAIETFVDATSPVSIVTKGPLVVRDIDVLQALSRATRCRVFMSVPCVDAAVSARLEPGAAPPIQRLRAVRELVRAGIDAGVLMSPIVPGISSRPALLERTVKAIADCGARFVGCAVLRLEGGTREYFLGWLAREYPALVDRYAHLYAEREPPPSYLGHVRALTARLREVHAPG